MRRRQILAGLLPHMQKPAQAAEKEQEAETPSAPPEELDYDALAAEFEETFGRKPGNMKPETMAARIAAEKDAAEDDDAK